jgi:3-oxoacyl-[acyl-carrier protein] reductase
VQSFESIQICGEVHMKVLISGASSGIGRELALQLHNQPLETLVILGRDIERLQSCENELRYSYPDALIGMHQLDLATASSLEIEDVCSSVWARYGALDLIICCAGVAHQGLLIDSTPEQIDQQIAVNVRAPLVMIRAFASLMVKHRVRKLLGPNSAGISTPGGRIIIVSSLMGVVAAPSFATYSATKFALVGFARALRKELFHHNIKVSVVLPTLTDTAMVKSFINFSGVEMLSARDVAKWIVARAVNNHNDEIIIGWQAKVAVMAKKFFPSLVEFALCRFAPIK